MSELVTPMRAMPPRRALAGLLSLSQRAVARPDMGAAQPPTFCSQYGDTDRRIPFTAGDTPDDCHVWTGVKSRRARVEGWLILHRTVGGRAEWRLDPTSVLTVRSTYADPPEESSATLADVSACTPDVCAACVHEVTGWATCETHVAIRATIADLAWRVALEDYALLIEETAGSNEEESEP